MAWMVTAAAGAAVEEGPSHWLHTVPTTPALHTPVHNVVQLSTVNTHTTL